MKMLAVLACMFAAAGTAAAASINYVNLSAVIAGGGGGGGRTLTYNSLNGFNSQGTSAGSITDVFSSNVSLLGQPSAFVGTAGELINGAQTNSDAAYASADLATGKLGVLASSTKVSGPNVGLGLGTGLAELKDIVTFTNMTSAPLAIDVSFTLHGTMFVDLANSGNAAETLQFCLGFSCMLASNTILANEFNYNFSISSGAGAFQNILLPTSGWLSVSYLPGDDPTFGVFHGVYVVPVGTSTAELYASLKLDCRSSATCDYRNTAALGFTLPTGVTFTSDSGVLLTANGGGTAAPEPQAWMLAAAGFGLLGLARLRQKRSKTHA